MPNCGHRVTYSTAQFVDEMDAVSRGLIALGMQAEEKVALISHNNRCEWNIMDHGIMQAGGIDVPIYPTMTEEDYKYILTHSGAKYCFVSNAELHAKVMAVKDQCPELEEVFTFEKVEGARHWSEVSEAGSDAQQAELDARRDAVEPARHPRIQRLPLELVERLVVRPLDNFDRSRTAPGRQELSLIHI